MRVAALLLLASAARATPATPPSLERLVGETPRILVARLVTRPAFVGDVYEVEVEETLKGEAPEGPVRVRAPGYFRGCCVQPDAPPAPALEAEARRVLLFLGEERVRKVVILDPEEAMSAWFGYGHAAGHGPGAVRKLLELDAADAEHAAALWVRGLRGQNPLLKDALLDRLDAVLSKHGSEYGPLERPRRDLGADRRGIVEAAVLCCASPFVSTRERALTCALHAMPLEEPLLGKALAAARESARDDSWWTREAALRLLIAADDTAAPEGVLAALKREDKYAVQAAIDFARELAARRADCRREVVRALLGLLERNDVAADAVAALRKVTGKELRTPAEWQELRAAHGG